MQDAVVAMLCDPRTYAHAPARVEHVQTHVSHVFLAGPFVYKLKKALQLPFVDQRTPEARAALCAEELRLNRRLSHDVYLGVLPIAAGDDGGLVLGGDGPAVDHVVWMRRLPADRMLARLVCDGRADAAMLVALADRLARFHTTAASGPEVAAHAAPERLRATFAQTLALATPLHGTVVAASRAALLADFADDFLRRHDTVLRARQRAGRVRDGHGDLHAEHVCVLDRPLPAAPPLHPLAPGLWVFDCLEFSPALRANDVAGEIGFLAMDLERLGRADLARAFVDAYVAASGDDGIRPLLPYYVCYRATVRGAVEGLRSLEDDVPGDQRRDAAARARTYFALAQRHAWSAEGPLAIAVCGPSGSGKTTLAAALADATGFVHLSSDVVRKRAAGLDPAQPALDPSALYGPAARAATYTLLAREAEALLASGRSVIVDATFVRRADRDVLAHVVHVERRQHAFLWCDVPDDVARARLADRPPGTSDATFATRVAQASTADLFGADEPHVVVDAARPPGEVLEAALAAAWAWARGRRAA